MWCLGLSRAYATVAKGIHFMSMGHSVPREVINDAGELKIQKRVELLPEETMYLVERGSLFCWKESDVDLSTLGTQRMQDSPMTVQQVYSEMIGHEDLTLEKYQVCVSSYR